MLLPFLLLGIIPSLLSSIALLFLFLYVALYRAPFITRRTSLGRSAVVVVLGDVGRSPRMCYHIESLADEGWKVSVVGYGGSKLPAGIQRNSVRFLRMEEAPRWIARLSQPAFVAVAPFKLLWQSTALFWKVAMVVQPPPEVIIVQTPPALPTLLVVRLCSLLLSARVIIDWHNLAYTILALRLGRKSVIVSLAAFLERLTGRVAFAHLFVTHAIKDHLDAKWNLRGHKAVLHDRPPKHFRRSTVCEKHRLWTELALRISPSLEGWWPQWQSKQSTPFTFAEPGNGRTRLRTDRPALAVSSTSWTADEDFGLLLKAAQLYERRAREVNSSPSGNSERSPSPATVTVAASHRNSSSTGLSSTDGSVFSATSSPHRGSEVFEAATLGIQHSGTSSPTERAPSPGSPLSPKAQRKTRYSFLTARSGVQLPNLPAQSLPRLLLIVTGKGEFRAKYEAEIARMEQAEQWEYVRIRTAWLENSEYPVLLGSADLGVSLHTSSSGLDLPMKIVDMLGCQLPVLALDFPCLGELIHHGKNGLTFKDEFSLCDGLESLLAGYPYVDSGAAASGAVGENWLIKGGGLHDPFALAGQVQGSTIKSSDPLGASLSPARQSLDVGAVLDEFEGQKLLSRRSLDFSKGGLPITNSSGSLSGSSSPSGSFWKLRSASASEKNGSALPSRPTTPTPTFTMLASLILEGSSCGTESFLAEPEAHCASSSTMTWSANWKSTVRPLLRLADEEDAQADGILFFDGEATGQTDNDDIDGSEVNGSLMLMSAPAPEVTVPPVNKNWAPTTPKKRRRGQRRRVGADGKPLGVRGDSVHGLLWSEDFGHDGLLGGCTASARQVVGAGFDQDDEDDADLEPDLLTTLGTVVSRSSLSQRHKSSSVTSNREDKDGDGSIPSTPRGKLRGLTVFKSSQRNDGKKSDDAIGMPSTMHGVDATAEEGGDTTTSSAMSQEDGISRQHLRHRNNKSAIVLDCERDHGDLVTSPVSSEAIPDIHVSTVEPGA